MTKEEAIKRVRSRFDKWALDSLDLAALQALGLVDVESEDEKIRKSIVSIINQYTRMCEKEGDPCNESLILDALAYLERQKEQNIYKSSKSEIDFADRYSKDVWEKLMSKFKAIEEYSIGCNDVFDIVLNAILNAFKWQKEQKLTEWSDSTAKEMFIKALDRAAKQTKKGYELTDCDKHSWWEDFKVYSGIKPTDWSEEDKKILNAAIEMVEKGNISFAFENNKYKVSDWLKLLPKRFGLQLKQEWSKEDKEMLGKVLECIRFTEDHYEFDGKEVSSTDVKLWLLESLHPQSKQEWSKEDREMKIKVLKYLSTRYDVFEYEEVENWFKSLSERFSIQSKQEWSEKDKEMKSNIIRTLQYMLENHTLDEELKEMIKDEINWLKSL